MTTKPEARAVQKAFVESFQEPIGMFLGDGVIFQGLGDAFAHALGSDGAQRIVDFLHIHTGFIRQVLQGLATLQRGGQVVRAHIEHFGHGFERRAVQATTTARTARPAFAKW
jgi:hypothetical protein